MISLLMASVSANSQASDSLTENFYHELYSFQFLSARNTLDQIRASRYDPIMKEMMYISYEWWMLISTEENRARAKYVLDRIERNINRLDQRLKSGNLIQDELLQMIMLYSYQSRINNHIDNKINGFMSFKASEEYFKQLSPCEDMSCDVYNLVAGLYYTLTGYIEKEYPGIYKLAMDEDLADIEKGLSLLSACENSIIDQIRTESNYFFMKLYLEVEPDLKKAESYANKLIARFPENLVFHLNHLVILDRLNDKEKLLPACQAFMQLTEKQTELSVAQKTYFTTECKKLESRHLN